MSELLNHSQHIYLAIALRSFEQSLREAEGWLRGRPSEALLYQGALRLAPERRAAALAAIAEALEGIRQLAARFEVRPEVEPLANRIAGAMAISWVNLTDTCSDRLGRYGPADPRLREALDPELERLARLALKIGALVKETDRGEDAA